MTAFTMILDLGKQYKVLPAWLTASNLGHPEFETKSATMSYCPRHMALLVISGGSQPSWTDKGLNSKVVMLQQVQMMQWVSVTCATLSTEHLPTSVDIRCKAQLCCLSCCITTEAFDPHRTVVDGDTARARKGASRVAAYWPCPLALPPEQI